MSTPTSFDSGFEFVQVMTVLRPLLVFITPGTVQRCFNPMSCASDVVATAVNVRIASKVKRLRFMGVPPLLVGQIDESSFGRSRGVKQDQVARGLNAYHPALT